jgi:hypothetical protein
MATVISGILNQRLPWHLVLMGVALVVAVEILGVRSLAFATGSYLPLGTTAAMFAGGLVRVLVEATTKKKDESEASPGALYSSGLIAAGGVFGLLGIIINLLQDSEISNRVPHFVTSILRLPWRTDLFTRPPDWFFRILFHLPYGHSVYNLGTRLSTSNLFGIFMFALLAASLFYFARKKLN